MKEVDIEGGWKVGQPYVSIVPFSVYQSHMFVSVPYAALAKVFALIEATTKRLEKTSLLTSFLLLVVQRSAPGDMDSLLQSVYLCINRVRVLYICGAYRVSDKTSALAMSGLCGR